MHRGRNVGAHSLALLGLFAVAAAGCDGCGGEPPPTGEPTVFVSLTNGTTLQADGSSTKQVEVVARDENGEPDNTAMTVTVSGGDILSDVGSVDGTTLSATPQAGSLIFEFRCPADGTGQFTINASNGNASGSATVSCVAPSGTTVLRLVDSEVQQERCSFLQATGASWCEITAIVERQLDAGGAPEPVAGVTLAASVIESSVVGTPDTPAATENVLSGDPADTFKQSELNLTTDDNGEAVFYVHSVTVDELAVFTIEVSGTALDSSVLSETATVEILPFDNQAALRITPAALSMAAGGTEPLTIEADNLLGNPAVDGTVTVRVNDGSGATLSADGGATQETEVEVTLDDAGNAVVDFTAPTIDDETIIVVTAVYQPGPSLPALSATSEVTVLPDGSLIVNAVATPATIRSDDNTETTINVTVRQLSGTSVGPVSGVTVDFEVQASDLERVVFGTRASPNGPTDSQTTDADGEATSATIASTTDRVLGPATIDVTVTYDDDNNASTPPIIEELGVTINVERDPILQSLVFLEALPAAVGVAGGAYPTSSLLSFQVLDDLNRPLAGATMTFRTNATADPDATVVPTAFTDAAGIANTVLSAGTQAGPISVVATASFQGRTLVVESIPVAVTAGLPSFANSYLVCDEEDLVQAPGPFSATCVAQLADRFTNRVPTGLPVQFRAEGGNIDANVPTGAFGSAAATFQTGQPGPSSASLLSWTGDSWSYGAVVPVSPSELGTSGTYTAADALACFDGSALDVDGRRCDLVHMCREASSTTPNNEIYCPLQYDDNGAGCWERLEFAALTGDANDLSQGFLDANGMTRAEAAEALLPANFTAQNYFGGTDAISQRVRTIVRGHIENMGRCGYPTSCLLGRRYGIPFVTGDECPVNLGCMDFSTGTRCPQDGALTLAAWFRGEESFTDINGNGVLDFDDEDGNGRHDPGEPILESATGAEVPFNEVVVDMSEPYLDKNDNCSYDDLRGSLRLSTYDAIRHTDQFSDESGDGEFGYVPATGGEAAFRNGQWDRDKQIWVTERMISLAGAARIDWGITCSAAQVGTEVTCPYDGIDYSCDPIQGGFRGIMRGCYPKPANVLSDGDSFQLAYTYIDANGNCFSPGYNHAMGVTFASERRLIIDGDLDVSPLGSSFCGVRSGGVLREREWCTSAAGLGQAHAVIDVELECENRFASQPEVELELVLDNDPSFRDSAGGDIAGYVRTDSIRFNTDCPYCGDGLTTAPEECDASDPNNVEDCAFDCTIIVQGT